jgi:hypothetical protein
MQPQDQLQSEQPQQPPIQPVLPPQPSFQQPSGDVYPSSATSQSSPYVAPIVPAGFDSSQPQTQGVPPVTTNPGKVMGIVSIVLGVLTIWVVGLPLAIVSLVKSKKAKASAALGIAGIVINVIAIFMSILLAVIFLTAFKSIQDKAKTDKESQSSVSRSAAEVDVPLGTSYFTDTGSAYWAFPSSFPGWEIITLDQDGANAMQRESGGARLVLYQGVDEFGSLSDEEASRSIIGEYLTSAGATAAGDEGRTTFPQMSDGKNVEFLTQHYTFSKDGETAKAIIAARAFAGTRILLVTYTSTAESYSESEWLDLSESMQISDSEF